LLGHSVDLQVLVFLTGVRPPALEFALRVADYVELVRFGLVEHLVHFGSKGLDEGLHQRRLVLTGEALNNSFSAKIDVRVVGPILLAVQINVKQRGFLILLDELVDALVEGRLLELVSDQVVGVQLVVNVKLGLVLVPDDIRRSYLLLLRFFVFLFLQ